MTKRLMHSLRAMSAIAVNTFRAAVRNKILGSLLFFAILVSFVGLLLGQMSLHEEVRVVRDLSLVASTLFAAIITIYSTVTLLHAEIEHRTLYTILSKPIPRWQFILGKYLGVVGLVMVILLILLGVSALLVALVGSSPDAVMLAAFFTVLLQMVILCAVSMLFASFSTPLLSGFFTATIFVVGNLFSQFEAVRALLQEEGMGGIRPMLTAFEIILPNFEQLNLANEFTYGIRIPASYLLHATAYATSYAALVLVLSVLIFSRRDFA